MRVESVARQALADRQRLLSVVPATTSAATDPGEANALAFVGLAAVMTVAVRIPNQRGRW